MGAGASIEQDEAKQKAQCDELYDTFNKSGDTLNYMEIKKGFEGEDAQVALKGMSTKAFFADADTNDDKQVSKEEFYEMMKKAMAAGQIEKTPETDAAATKLQSIQRGKNAKAEVQEKKEQIGAATKIQAIQRGKNARKGSGSEGADNASRIKKLFNDLDFKGNKFIEYDELKILLGDDEAKEIISELDGNFSEVKDGKIQLEEFEKFFLDLSDEQVSKTLVMMEGLVVGMNKEQTEAVTKLQAIARGRNAKAEVKDKKDQIGAATKIQAIQRGKNTRKGSGSDAAAVDAATVDASTVDNAAATAVAAVEVGDAA